MRSKELGFKRVWSTTGVVALTGALLLTSAPVASADQVRDAQWPLTVYNAEKVWKISQGAGVTVAVVDSGVDSSQPDLAGQVLPGKDFTGAGDPHKDTDGHGTAMASIIGGHGHGVNDSAGVMGLAPKAKILPVKVSYKNTATWAAGIRYAVDQGASVINLSFGDSGGYPGSKGAEAIAYAQEHDVVLVSATGNDSGTVTYPAALPGVVAVSGVDKDLSFWSDSNTGKVTVAAPGVELAQVDPNTKSGYSVANGTSGASAYVSAIAALLRSKYPDLTAGQIINRLVKSASFLNNKGKTAPDKELGYGIARPGSALTMNIPKGPKEGPLAQASTSTESGAANGNESTSQAKERKDSSSGGILLIAGIAAAVVLIGGIVFAVIRSRRNRGNGGPGPGGGIPPHGTGYPPQPPTGYQPYPNTPPNQGYPTPPGQSPQQHNPYAQQPPHQGQ